MLAWRLRRGDPALRRGEGEPADTDCQLRGHDDRALQRRDRHPLSGRAVGRRGAQRRRADAILGLADLPRAAHARPRMGCVGHAGGRRRGQGWRFPALIAAVHGRAQLRNAHDEGHPQGQGGGRHGVCSRERLRDGRNGRDRGAGPQRSGGRANGAADDPASHANGGRARVHHPADLPLPRDGRGRSAAVLAHDNRHVPAPAAPSRGRVDDLVAATTARAEGRRSRQELR